jgi:DNA repair protein RecN (Recombination protein N)
MLRHAENVSESEGTFGSMLDEMRISGLGVIADAAIELGPGLTVVTGETGAGKTMLVTGLHLLSGGRAEVSRVRSGATRAVVEGRFRIAGEGRAAEVIADTGAEPDEDGSVIALRTVGADGRSRAHLGGRSVPVSALATLSEQVLAVHGQSDQLRLLRAAEQRAALDRYAGEAFHRLLDEYQRARREWLTTTAELRDRTERSRELAREADLLRHGLDEIAAVNPERGEDRALVDTARRLAGVEDLREQASSAQSALGGSDQPDGAAAGAASLLEYARRALGGSEDPELRALAPRLTEAATLTSDVEAELAGYLSNLHDDPTQLERVLARQAELKALTRKYAADIDGVLDWAEEARDRLSGLDTSEDAIAELTARQAELAAGLARLAGELSTRRRAAADSLGTAVTTELRELAMPDATVGVMVSRKQPDPADPLAVRLAGHDVHIGQYGADEVGFLLHPNAASGALPIGKAASGGELSRVMLALEVVLAHANPVPALVFDEVDAGVGGRAAIEIGRRLARLATSHQVIVVTHLPQVAAYADRHLMVRMGTDGEVTASGVRTLTSAERVTELARMLAGMESTDTGRAHAEELLTAASADKAGYGQISEDSGRERLPGASSTREETSSA